MARSRGPVTAETALKRATAFALGDDADDYPVREYVGGIALELAEMARSSGDAFLASALEIAADIASRPVTPASLSPRRPERSA